MAPILKAAVRAAVLAGCGTAASTTLAQSPSPYDLTYRLRDGGPQPLYAQMSAGGTIGALPAGASGIQLRWCRSEIPFGTWQFGTLKQQLKLLDERWCEVSHAGRIGNVPGAVLTPE